MTANKRMFYWQDNEEWFYTKTNSKGYVKFILTNKAPKEARKSFRAYKRYIRIRKLMGTW
ncbi:MAG: hypothetical protein LUG60_09975 [Erysipelotrichaceae bacterium]|nr:hypothetical protein [Erysipelotrichaceae bacterium]